MTLKEKLRSLAHEKNAPCVTISLNTHRTHPDNQIDMVVLKNLLSEAEERVIDEFGKRDVAALLQKIREMEKMIDPNYNLDSLHIFLSNDTQEIIRTEWPIEKNGVHIADTFSIRPLLKAMNRSEDYLILLLSQGGVHLYEALNDLVIEEIRNKDFPFSESGYYTTDSDKGTDSKLQDDLVREFLNRVDKAMVQVHQEHELPCVVICTEDNYSRLMQVADKPSIYWGNVPVDYNRVERHHIAKQAWKLVQEKQRERRSKWIEDIKESVGQGKVITDLQEIYQAALEGRGELLMVHEGFSQPVLMKTDRTFMPVRDTSHPDVIDDITSLIAWEVQSKKGKVIFTEQEEIKDLGPIVLKTRY